MTLLCDLAMKYGTDKCPQIKHSFTPFYYNLLKDKPIKKVLEMGILGGASLRMWRDFFPNAQIYGADIQTRALLKEDRIETFYCNQLKRDDLVTLLEKTGTDIDLFVDDGLHNKESQLFTAQNLMPLFKKDVIYIMEDVRSPEWLATELPDYICEVPELVGKKHHDDRLLIVKNK